MDTQPVCESGASVGSLNAAHAVVTGALALLEAHVATLREPDRGRARLLELLDSISIVECEARARRENLVRTVVGARSPRLRRFVDDQVVCMTLLDDLRLRVADLGRTPAALERVRRAAIDFVTQQRELMTGFERRFVRRDHRLAAA